MRRVLFPALLALVIFVGGCDAARTAGPDLPERLANLPPIDEGGCCEGGGGGETGGGTVTPPSDQYRITYVLYRDRIDVGDYGGTGYRFVMKAYTQFEQNIGGTWRPTNATNVSISCYVEGVLRDQETESNASRVDLTFGVEYAINRLVTCQHSANNGAYTGTTSYNIYSL